ncbi:MAG: nucleotidyltransferase family protein [Deltaproteobacteria bacterium]|jgi:predicted nucleotidyltransferase|nr:nucleotidyltransferase family protein [Deltaproteobacteria bacterium]
MDYTVEDIRRIIEPIARRREVERVWLFGSYARGDAGPDSDVDIRLDKGEIRGYFQLGGLYNELEKALGIKPDLLTTGSLSDDFLALISKDEVLIYESVAAQSKCPGLTLNQNVSWRNSICTGATEAPNCPRTNAIKFAQYDELLN